jgi:hypothetical protein
MVVTEAAKERMMGVVKTMRFRRVQELELEVKPDGLMRMAKGAISPGQLFTGENQSDYGAAVKFAEGEWEEVLPPPTVESPATDEPDSPEKKELDEFLADALPPRTGYSDWARKHEARLNQRVREATKRARRDQLAKKRRKKKAR